MHVCLAAAVVVAAAPDGLAAQRPEGTKRALIIAVGEYGTPAPNPATGQPLRGYRDLNSANDVPLVHGALEHQGFLARDIRVLTDADATATGIRSALGQLVRDTGRGDVVVIHYSGHGHRIGNDNPDEDLEVDGFDEVLVPHGAPEEFYEGYDGAQHVRDDELGEIIAQIRARAGRAGSVTVFLDACYSGTGTRGDDELPSRGEEEPLGPPNRPRAGGAQDDDDRGTGIELRASAATRGGDEDLASFAVFTAASPRQQAKEVRDVDGRTAVGSLSYAIARALPEAGPGTTNRALFAALTRSLSGKVSSQTPQMEGDADRELFSNRLRQQLAYVVVDSVTTAGVVLGGGTLLGLNPATVLAVHPLGTTAPDGTGALATVRVREATPIRAVAEVIGGALPPSAAGSWAFVTERSYGDLALRVRLDATLPERDRTGLGRALAESGRVSLVDEGGDVIVASRDGQPEARTAEGLVLATGAQRVREGVERYAQNRYLRRLSFETTELDIVLEVATGVEVRRRANRSQYCAADWARAEERPEYVGGAQWRLLPGDLYLVRARNVGERRAFIHLVDLRPAGEIDVLWPPEGQTAEQLEPGETLEFPCFRVSQGDSGHEVLKLFATGTAQDLRPWLQTSGTRGSAELALSREVSIHIQPRAEGRE